MDFNIEEERRKWTLSKSEFEENANEIFAELALMANISGKMTFALVGGQAGSGKTGLVSKIYQELDGNAIIIDQDELRTKYPIDKYKIIHDNYTERQEFLILNPYIADLIQALIKRASDRGYSIIIESALQDVEAFIKNAQNLKEKGYNTKLAVLSVPEIEGNISMLKRYCYYLQKDGECRRNTRINTEAISKMKNNIKKINDMQLFDDISIYIRGKTENELPMQIYSVNQKNSKETPIQAFERGQKMSWERVKKDFSEKYKSIKKILEEHGENEQLQKLEYIYEQFIERGDRED